MKEKRQQIVKIGVFILCMISVVYVGKDIIWETSSGSVKDVGEKRCVVIDAGHGKTAGRPKEFERKCSVLSSVSCSGSII